MNWFWRTFLWKFPRISAYLVDIFSSYSPELVTRDYLELVTRNYLDRVMRNSSEWSTRNSSELVTRNSMEWVTKNSPEGVTEILWKGLREIPKHFCRHFHRIFLWKIPGKFRELSAKLLPGTIWVVKCGFSEKNQSYIL